jgi:hypothetical protein
VQSKVPIRVGSGPGLVLTGEVSAITNAVHDEPRLRESWHSKISASITAPQPCSPLRLPHAHHGRVGGLGRGPCVALICSRTMLLTTGQREVLKLLANAADGHTVPFMLSHGCSVAALRRLARCRLAVTDRVREPG